MPSSVEFYPLRWSDLWASEDLISDQPSVEYERADESPNRCESPQFAIRPTPARMWQMRACSKLFLKASEVDPT